MKALFAATALALGLIASPAAFADAKATCEKSAADKKLAGAAKDSHIKKCMTDAGASGGAQAACEKSAADKKLAGAAKDSHIKKCISDAGGAKK